MLFYSAVSTRLSPQTGHYMTRWRSFYIGYNITILMTCTNVVRRQISQKIAICKDSAVSYNDINQVLPLTTRDKYGPRTVSVVWNLRCAADHLPPLTAMPAVDVHEKFEMGTWSLLETSNGSWCMGIKGEMSGTICVKFTWDIYIVVYSFCLFCCLFIIVTEYRIQKLYCPP